MSCVIAIDGPAASGKGSLARALAQRFDFDFLDTGTLYRRVALAALQNGLDQNDHDQIIALAQNLNPEDTFNDSDLRKDHVGSMASVVAQIQEVRDALVQYQRNFAQNAPKGAVLDGRDIGTFICPDADIKLFVTASVEERAKRRHKELQSRGIPSTYASVLAEMRERDARDNVRLDEHLKADHKKTIHILDTSDMSADVVLNKAIDIVSTHIS